MSFLDKVFHRHPPEWASELGRNELCWCGSGKKYKRCHYEPDKEYFAARTLKGACRGPV